MTVWSLNLSPRAKKQLKGFDAPVTRRIVSALERLETVPDPAAHCKALTGPYTGLWRYRVGDWRVILDIDRGQLVILALEVGHRSKIY